MCVNSPLHLALVDRGLEPYGVRLVVAVDTQRVEVVVVDDESNPVRSIVMCDLAGGGLTRRISRLRRLVRSRGCARPAGQSLASGGRERCRRTTPFLSTVSDSSVARISHFTFYDGEDLRSIVLNLKVAHSTSSEPPRRRRHSCRQDPMRTISNIFNGRQK